MFSRVAHFNRLTKPRLVIGMWLFAPNFQAGKNDSFRPQPSGHARKNRQNLTKVIKEQKGRGSVTVEISFSPDLLSAQLFS